MGPTRELSVLLVEDNPGDARLIETYFGNGNRDAFHLRVVGRLSEAIQEVGEDSPDAILLDLGLPDSQGLETLDRISKAFAGTPIVVLTGLNDEELALEAIQRGAQDYLPKGGFDEVLLTRTIRYAVERTAAEALAQRNQERYQRLFEQANEAVLVVQDETIVGANPVAKEVFGWTSDELIGKPFAELVAADDQDLIMDRYRRRMAGEDPPSRYEFRVRHRSGGTRWVEVSTGRMEWKGKVAGLSLLTDITERKRSEEQMARLLARQTAVNELTLALGMTRDPTEIHKILHEHVSRVLHADALIVSSFDPEAEKIRAEYAFLDGSQADVSDFPELPLAPPGKGVQSEVIRSGKPVLVGDYSGAHAQHESMFNVERDGRMAPVTDGTSAEKVETESMMQIPMIAEGQVIGVIQLQSMTPNAFSQEDLELVAGLANVVAIALRNSELVLESQEQAAKIREAFEGIIQTVSRTTETRDPYTAGHQQRVAQLAAATAETLGLDTDTIEGVRVAGTVHDIGKIGIPAEILSKPGRLTETEFKIIQAHCESAYRILESIDFPWPIAEVVYQHHERLDGSGYPRGLKDDEITLEARILAVADVVEAMASHRPYRPALGVEAALEEIKTLSGTRLDRQAVEACVALFEERGFRFDEPASS